MGGLSETVGGQALKFENQTVRHHARKTLGIHGQLEVPELKAVGHTILPHRKCPHFDEDGLYLGTQMVIENYAKDNMIFNVLFSCLEVKTWQVS